MTIDKIVINKFGCHKNLTLDFTEGINLLVGKNESGKSTILAFIRAMLYGLEGRAQDNPRKKYLPWDANPEDRFGGELYFTQDNFKYKAVSVFTSAKRTDMTTLYNDVTGAIIVIPDGKTIGEYILGLSPTAYDCTVFAKQLESKADYKKDKDGFLTAKLSAVSNNTATSSSKFAEKNLGEALSKITNKKGEGLLDRAIVKRDLLQNALYHYEEREERTGSLAAELEDLDREEAEKADLCEYYRQFEEIKDAYNTIDYCNMVSHKHRDLRKIEKEIEELENPVDVELDLPEKRSKGITFLAVLFTLIFGAGAFFSTLFILQRQNVLNLTAVLLGTAVALFIAILCISKSKRVVAPEIDDTEDSERLEMLRRELDEGQDELIDIMCGITTDEYEMRFKEANEIIKNSGLDEKTLSEIRQCSSDVIKSRLEEANNALFEVKSKKSYTKARIESMEENSGPANIDDLTDGLDIYSALDKTNKEIGMYKEKKRMLELCQDILADSVEELQNTFGPMINEKTEKNLERIAGKRFGSLKISSEFEMSVYDGSVSLSHSSSDYSGATVDQMYLALRFTLAEVMAPKTSSLPLYLDDPFVQYDDARFKTALDFIRDYSSSTNTQIIIASCQSRALEALSDCNRLELGGNA